MISSTQPSLYWSILDCTPFYPCKIRNQLDGGDECWREVTASETLDPDHADSMLNDVVIAHAHSQEGVGESRRQKLRSIDPFLTRVSNFKRRSLIHQRQWPAHGQFPIHRPSPSQTRISRVRDWFATASVCLSYICTYSVDRNLKSLRHVLGGDARVVRPQAGPSDPSHQTWAPQTFLILVHYSRRQSIRQSPFLVSPFCLSLMMHPFLPLQFNQLSHPLCRRNQFDITRCTSIMN